MKTKLLLLLLLANFSIYAQQYTSIPDANFENKLISLGIDSGTPDGRVLKSKVSSLTSLNVSTSAIVDLTGIEDFTALKDLRCSSNRITNLNLSKNTALTSLECNNNLLTVLDISNNPLLVKLECSLNKLTALDFSNNTVLKTIDCSNNQLTALNVSNLLTLEIFNCEENKIEVLDLSSNLTLSRLTCHNNLLKDIDLSKNNKLFAVRAHNNRFISFNIQNGTNYLFDNPSSTLTFNSPNLKCVQVDNVEEANVRWASVKGDAQYSTYCSPYTLIPDVNFEKKLIALGIDKDGENGKVLTAAISSVTSLNVSNSSITDLTGIQDFHNLIYLFCDGNQLSTLDITKNIYLTSLSCNQNKITTLNLNNNRALKTLSCSSNQLTKIDLSYCSLLQISDLSKNKIDKLDVGHNQALTSLNVDENLITNLNLLNNSALTSLSVNANRLAILNLANNTLLTNAVSFKSNPELYCIQVSNVAYANTNWSDKKENITSFSSIPCILTDYFTLIPDINFENKLISLGIDSGTADGKILTSKVTSLTSLNVSQSSITNLTGIEAFVALKTLNCSNNRLTQLNVSKNTLLTSLQSNSNQLSALDLSNNTLLLALECSHNNILALNFSNNTALKSIKCDDNFLKGIDLSKQLALENLDVNFNRLQNLDLSFNLNLQSFICNNNSIENLDLSKNSKLTTMLAHINELTSLNIKNGTNYLFKNPGSTIRFDYNEFLTCIEVDNVEEANTNWSNQKNPNARFSTDCNSTLIPDINFENKLISLGIDSGAPDGKVLTTSISSLNYLDVSNSSIRDLTGIGSFKELKVLSASKNQIATIDLSSNKNLTVIDLRENKLKNLNIQSNVLLRGVSVSKNELTSLDVSQNINLTDITADNNQLTTLDLSANPQLTNLFIYNNQLTTLDLSKNKALDHVNCSANKLTSLNLQNVSSIRFLTCYDNLLTSLNVSDQISLIELFCYKNSLTNLNLTNNTQLSSLDCTDNKLTNLDVTQNTKLFWLGCEKNQLSAINVSKNTMLNQLYVSDNALTSIDVFKNPELTIFYCYSNLLTSVDISKNTKLKYLQVDMNNLTSLNLKNGTNTLLDRKYTNFNKNPNLTCIQVDDIAYSNANWSHLKDATASYNIECDFNLPANNFAVESKGESCLGENNGEINITASAEFPYIANINGKPTAFINNSLKINNLTPGTYTIIVTIPGEVYEQTFNLEIAKAAAVAGSLKTTSKTVDVEITEGTAPFTIFVDGREQFQTNDASFSVDINKNALIEVATAKACEGTYAKKVSISDFESETASLSAYPNPTSGKFEIEIPAEKKEVTIELYNFGGQLVSSKIYSVENGKAQLNLENQSSGIYAAKIYLDTPKYIKIIKR